MSAVQSGIMECVRPDAHLNTSPLEECLVCGYRLEGLPEKYRCPECAAEFDKKSIVINIEGKSWNLFAQIVSPFLWFILAIFCVIQDTIFTAVVLPLLIYEAAFFLARRRRNIRFALTPVELLIVDANRRIHALNWSAILHVRFDWVFCNVYIETREPWRTRKLSYRYFGTVKGAREFAALANKWKRKHWLNEVQAQATTTPANDSKNFDFFAPDRVAEKK